MSVLITGMEMPKSCRDCGIEQEGFWCGALDGYQNTRCFTNERREDCPLVPVPPHGRLIDADALMEIISKVIDINASIEQRNEATDQERRSLWWFEEQVNIAPTIIPAEESE